MKKLLLLFVAAAFLAACGNQEEVEEATYMGVHEFSEMAADLVDSTVTVKGIVHHICGGDPGKIHFQCINDEEHTIHIFSSEEMGDFDTTLPGATILATGIVEVDTPHTMVKAEKYLAEDQHMLDSLNAIVTDGMEEVEVTKVEKGIEFYTKRINYVNELKAEMEELGQEYILGYNLIVNEIELVEEGDGKGQECDGEDHDHDHEDGEEHDHDHEEGEDHDHE